MSADRDNPRSNETPSSVLLAANCSSCFAVVLHDNRFISGCRRDGWRESRTFNEFFGVMCSRFPTYCGDNLCCCSSVSCYDDLRSHFLESFLKRHKGIVCDVYRQQWIELDREKGLNKSSYPTAEQMYRRKNCIACGSRVDEQGVEMTCIERDIDSSCKAMNLLVGGSVACTGNGDCCCQGEDCPEQLRNFYSGNQKMMGPPKISGPPTDLSRSNANSLAFAILLPTIIHLCFVAECYQ